MSRLAMCARCTNDIHLEAPRVLHQKLTAMEGGETSAGIRAHRGRAHPPIATLRAA